MLLELLAVVGIAAAPAAEPLVLTHAVIVDGSGGPALEDASVVIRGERIEAVGPSASVSAPPGSRNIDLAGMTVLPGLADMHVHLMGGWDGEAVDMLGYRRYLSALLYAGVTTVLDTGNVQPFILQIRQEVAAGRILGPRIYCAGPVIDGSDPVWPPISIAVSSVQQIPGIVEQLKKAGVDVLKGYVGLSDSMVRKLAEEGRKASLSLFVDQWTRNGSVDSMEAGIAAFAHTPVREMSEGDVALLKEKDIQVVTTLSVYESFSRRRLRDLSFLDHPLVRDTTPPWVLGEIRQRRFGEAGEMELTFGRVAQAQRNAKQLADAGVLLVAGTDAPYPGVFQGEGIHRELELLVEAGLTPLQAIAAATGNAARLMKAESEWGTVSAGKIANLLVVRGRPDRNVSETRNVEMVLLKGEILDRSALRFDPATDPGFRTGASVSVP